MTALVVFLVCTNVVTLGSAVYLRNLLSNALDRAEAHERGERTLNRHRDYLMHRLYVVTKRHTHVGTYREFFDSVRKEMES